MPSPASNNAAFHKLTSEGLKTLAERLADAQGSAIATSGTAHHSGNQKLAAELSSMGTRLGELLTSVEAFRAKHAALH